MLQRSQHWVAIIWRSAVDKILPTVNRSQKNILMIIGNLLTAFYNKFDEEGARAA
jgi:hypothetical protein